MPKTKKSDKPTKEQLTKFLFDDVTAPRDPRPEWHEEILKDPYFTSTYVRDVLKQPWPEAEPILAANGEYAYYYAKDILKGRWVIAEDAIMSSRFAELYVLHVYKAPWPEAEEIMLKTSEFAMRYAVQILKKRWIPAEEVLLKDDSKHAPGFCFTYARDAIKGQWEEGEAVIFKNPIFTAWYCQHVLNSPYEPAEEAILSSSMENRAYACFKYAKEVLHDRFPAGEPFMEADNCASMYKEFIESLIKKNIHNTDVDLTPWFSYVYPSMTEDMKLKYINDLLESESK